MGSKTMPWVQSVTQYLPSCDLWCSSFSLPPSTDHYTERSIQDAFSGDSKAGKQKEDGEGVTVRESDASVAKLTAAQYHRERYSGHALGKGWVTAGGRTRLSGQEPLAYLVPDGLG